MDLLLPLPSIWTQLFIRITANKLFPLELLKMSVIILKKQNKNKTQLLRNKQNHYDQRTTRHDTYSILKKNRLACFNRYCKLEGEKQSMPGCVCLLFNARSKARVTHSCPALAAVKARGC